MSRRRISKTVASTQDEWRVAACYASPSEVGFRVKWLRHRFKLTLVQLEKKAAVSATTILRMENGNAMGIALGAFLQICQALDTTAAEMLRAREED